MAVDEGGTLTLGGDFTVSFTASLENGREMVIDQHHTGLMEASWAWEGTGSSRVVLSDFVPGDYTVESTLDVDGQVSVAEPDTAPTALLDESPMTIVACSATELVTDQIDGYRITWYRLS